MGNERTVVVAGYYGFGNLGDEAIRIALGKVLDSCEGLRPIWLVSQPHTASEVSRAHPLRILAALRGASALLFGGGGLLQNRTSNRSLLYYLFLILLARIARRPVFLLGQGIGPIQGRLARRVTCFMLSRVRYLGCRDQGSLDLLWEMGLTGVLDGDLFFLFLPGDRPTTTLPHDEPRIVLCLKGPDTPARPRLIERFVELLEGLHAQVNASFTLLPPFPAEDQAFAEGIAQRLNFPCRLSNPLCVEEASEEITGADLLISSRLHPLEFALRTGTPMLALAEDPKIKEFADEVRSAGGPHLPCTPFPSLEEVLLLLEAPPERNSLQAAYHRLHERMATVFMQFLGELEVVLGARDG